MYNFKNNSRVCFFGDSITAKGIWIRRIYDYYRNNLKINIEMYNCGVPGDSSVNAMKHIDQTLFYYNPTDVVIFFGMNDVGYHLYGVEKPSADIIKARRDGIDKCVGTIEKLSQLLVSKGINIIYCTPTPYDELNDSSTPCLAGTNGGLYEIRCRILELADKFGGHVVDFYDGMYSILKTMYKNGKSPISADRIHPNAHSMEAMSQLFLKAQGFTLEVADSEEKQLKAYSVPYDNWEEKRFALETQAKKIEFAKWCLFPEEDDFEKVAENIKQFINIGHKPELMRYYNTYLEYYKDYDKDREALLNHTKSVCTGGRK